MKKEPIKIISNIFICVYYPVLCKSYQLYIFHLYTSLEISVTHIYMCYTWKMETLSFRTKFIG